MPSKISKVSHIELRGVFNPCTMKVVTALTKLNSVYRSQSLMQNYALTKVDQGVAIEGHQNMSFSFAGSQLTQRIERSFTPSYYWLFGKGSLTPIAYDLIVSGGRNGFACYVRGNNLIYKQPEFVAGYTDGLWCLRSKQDLAY